MKTNVYIDGFNLYYGCLKGTPHKWLDLAAFCQASFPPPRNQINRIRYFTAHLTARPNDPLQLRRQQIYLRALRTLSHLTIHLGSYVEKPTRMPLHPMPTTEPKTVQVMKSEEKGSDVNIATYLLVDAFDDEYETAVVVTNDSDLAEPIRLGGEGMRRRRGLATGKTVALDNVTLISRRHGLTGRPDRLIREGSMVTPEEWKSARQLRGWHRAQMGVYFLLIEDQLKVRPTHGFVVLGDGGRHRIENTKELRAWVLELVGQIRAARNAVTVPIPVNPRPGQCRPCGMREHCGQARL